MPLQVYNAKLLQLSTKFLFYLYYSNAIYNITVRIISLYFTTHTVTCVDVWLTVLPTRSMTGGIFFIYFAAVFFTQAGRVAEKNNVCGFFPFSKTGKAEK